MEFASISNEEREKLKETAAILDKLSKMQWPSITMQGTVEMADQELSSFLHLLDDLLSPTT